jgi:hypothetical protein
MDPGSRRSTQSSTEGRRGPHNFGERWSWVQFWCAFLFAGLLTFLFLAFDPFWIHLASTLAVAAVFGALAGRYGDEIWSILSAWLRWP